MERFNNIIFDCSGNIEETKKKVLDCVDKAYAKEKKEMKHCDEFITLICKLVKNIVNDDDFSKLADAWKENMLTLNNSNKRSFVVSYTKSLHDIVDDIVGLVKEYTLLSKGKETADEKSEIKDK